METVSKLGADLSLSPYMTVVVTVMCKMYKYLFYLMKREPFTFLLGNLLSPLFLYLRDLIPYDTRQRDLCASCHGIKASIEGRSLKNKEDIKGATSSLSPVIPDLLIFGNWS